MNNPITERIVSRVLVMLQYPDEERADVFDLTALAVELGEKTEHRHAIVELEVKARADYSKDSPYPMKTEASWDVMANFNSSGQAGFLEDAVNSSMPDSMATHELRKKLERVKKKADDLSKDIQVQRLLDAAKVRNQHPIARVTETPVLTEVATRQT